MDPRHFDDEELIAVARSHDDPLVREFGIRFAKTSDELAHEATRIEEFYRENQQFLAEIKHLKSELQAQKEKKDGPMLEQQLEKTNELLAQILDRLGAGAPAPEVPPLPDVPQSKKEKPVKAKAQPAATVEEGPDDEDADEVITLEDARAVLVTLSKAYGRAAALEVLGQFGAKKIGDVKPGDYGALLEACANYDQKEAA